MADKKEGSVNRKTRKNQNKVRVKLPGIESYEKTLEFAAEGPGRVVVRLERLMGSDRIRITDPKYLSTLVERLEAEEAQSWGSRSRLRKKAEKNRSRQLAIEGLMEPTSDMQDLYEHPVFRVNRVLNRLSVFDQNMSSTGVVEKIPPIVPVEPFENDETGKIFRTYPQHQIFHKEMLPFDNSRYNRLTSQHSRGDLSRHTVGSSSPSHSVHSMHSAHSDMRPATKQPQKEAKAPPTATTSVKSTKSLFRAEDGQMSAAESTKPSEMALSAKPSAKVSKKASKKKKTDDEEEEEGQDAVLELEEDEEDEEGQEAGEGKMDSLQDFKIRYGVPSDANLVRDWQAFRSHLVERVYEETGGSAEELYDLASEVIGTYDRQMITVEDYILEREEKVREERKAMGLPSLTEIIGDEDNEEEEEEDAGEGNENEDEEEEGVKDAEEEGEEKEEDEEKEEEEGGEEEEVEAQDEDAEENAGDGEGDEGDEQEE